MDLCELGADLLGSSSVEKDLGVLVDNELLMSQQRVLVAKEAKGVMRNPNKIIDGVLNRSAARFLWSKNECRPNSFIFSTYPRLKSHKENKSKLL
ncbi:hypothetical protein TURU_093173 [Turdus rufiventris]|nr:hypothetical protein TURU_093173 [Turdus rufiventris]